MLSTAYLTCQQAANHLLLSYKTLEKWRSLGVGPRFCKMGRRVRYRLVDLNDWEAANVKSSTSV